MNACDLRSSGGWRCRRRSRRLAADEETTVAEYDALVGALTAAGTIPDATRLYWDMRPSARYPTLEFRVADASPTRGRGGDDRRPDPRGGDGRRARPRHREAAGGPPSRAARGSDLAGARDGLDGELIDVERPGRVPAALLVERLLEHVRPGLEERGEWEEVEGLVRETLRHGNGATRQRAAFQRRGRVDDVVEMVAGEVTRGFGYH